MLRGGGDKETPALCSDDGHSSGERFDSAVRLPAPAAGTDTAVQPKRRADEMLLPTDKIMSALR